jgi:hypothetical protein
MTTDDNSVVKFEWGTVTTAVVGLIVGVPTETERGLLPGSTFNADGTIILIIPKSTVGSPQPGDLLGAINGRTFTGDTPDTENLQRSTLLIDHTFVKAQRDNGHPAATYTVVGNTVCPTGTIVPVRAVSRKTHGGSGDWVVELPLIGNPGIECRGTTGGHTMVITFANPVTINGSTTPPPSGASVTGTGTVSNITVNGSVVTVDLTGVANEQTIIVTLLNVSDGPNTGNVPVPMGVLLGDVNASRIVTTGDANLSKAQNLQPITSENFRTDVNASGTITTGDVNIIKQNNLKSLP